MYIVQKVPTITSLPHQASTLSTVPLLPSQPSCHVSLETIALMVLSDFVPVVDTLRTVPPRLHVMDYVMQAFIVQRVAHLASRHLALEARGEQSVRSVTPALVSVYVVITALPTAHHQHNLSVVVSIITVPTDPLHLLQSKLDITVLGVRSTRDLTRQDVILC